MTVKAIPAGYHTVTPYLVVPDAAAEIAFVEKAFGATVTFASKTPDGRVMHAELRIGDSMVVLGQARQPSEARQCMLYLYVDDCEAWFKRATEAGSKIVAPLQDQFYGDRSGGVEDPAGNQWWIGTHVEDVSPEEIALRAAKLGK